MPFLSDALLGKIHARADQYDRENVFPEQDYEDLKAAGYLGAAVPVAYGGAGLTLAEIAQEQTRLAAASPGTALGINMHQIIVGLGKTIVAAGNKRGEQILRGAVAGELFGFGISEPQNDLVLFGSISEARPDNKGGYSFYGTKIFTSLAPAWTRLMTFGRDDSGADGPHSVFAILHREDGGFEIEDDWDTLGMRATQSNTTILNGASASPEQILTRTPAGSAEDPVIFGIFGNFEILLAATYAGIGKRAIEVAVETVKQRASVRTGSVYANDPDIRWLIAEAAITMDAVYPQIESIARAYEAGEDRGNYWMPQLSAVKNNATEAAKKAVDQAIRASGGASYFSGQELSRLYRDVLAGLFQPSDQESLHGAWAGLLLGPIE